MSFPRPRCPFCCSPSRQWQRANRTGILRGSAGQAPTDIAVRNQPLDVNFGELIELLCVLGAPVKTAAEPHGRKGFGVALAGHVAACAKKTTGKTRHETSSKVLPASAARSLRTAMPDFRRMPAMKAETSPTRVAAKAGANPAAAKTPATDAVTLQARAGLNSVAGRQVSARTESVPAVKTERRRREKIVKSAINGTRSSGIGSGDNALHAACCGRRQAAASGYQARFQDRWRRRFHLCGEVHVSNSRARLRQLRPSRVCEEALA